MNTVIKRCLDIVLALPVFFLLSPAIFCIAIAVRISIGVPILFVQTRPGLHGKPFKIYKFRTMSDDRDALNNLLPDADRLTRFGKFLRATSLDELPELMNILKGDMSVVGPRPLLMKYLVRYTAEQSRRHDVKPGLTGWAQVNGRNAISWEEKLNLDVWYVEHQTLFLDLKIIAMTIKQVIKQEGISHEGEATMMEFRGI